MKAILFTFALALLATIVLARVSILSLLNLKVSFTLSHFKFCPMSKQEVKIRLIAVVFNLETKQLKLEQELLHSLQ